MTDFVIPRVVLSKCLEIEACRYNGEKIPNQFVKVLEPYVEYLPICPEVEVGLGIPRDPVRLVKKEGKNHLLQPSTGVDVTEKMEDFATSFLESLDRVDGFILKNRSPSCGIKDARIYPSPGDKIASEKGPGLFASFVLEKFPGLAAEDEGRLKNYQIREHFLTKLYTLTRFRKAKESGRVENLIQFQTRHKLLLMAYNQTRMRNLGRILGEQSQRPFSRVVKDYEKELHQALSRRASYKSNINVLMHAMGYFSRELSAKEKAFFLDELEKYRQEKTPLSSLLSILRSWIIRFGEDYLEKQFYFEPYPEDLSLLSDSGKGRLSR